MAKMIFWEASWGDSSIQHDPSGILLGRFRALGPEIAKMTLWGASWGGFLALARNCQNDRLGDALGRFFALGPHMAKMTLREASWGDNLRLLELENTVGCRKNLQISSPGSAKNAFPAEESCESAAVDSQKY